MHQYLHHGTLIPSCAPGQKTKMGDNRLGNNCYIVHKLVSKGMLISQQIGEEETAFVCL